jgi:hypothetical protein
MSFLTWAEAGADPSQSSANAQAISRKGAAKERCERRRGAKAQVTRFS